MNKPTVFFIMPFDDNYLALFERLKETHLEKLNFTHAGDLDNQRNILHDIVEGISTSDIVIADLTGLNPNVFYELGLAHAMNKKVIIITQDISELPFDLQSYRAIQYSLLFNKLPDFEKELDSLLLGAINDSVKFGNPVTDYLPNVTFINHPKELLNDSTPVDSDEETSEESSDNKLADDGFLDFIANIEENTDNMTNELNELVIDMDEMTKSINVATGEIDRVNTQSGNSSGNASFIRSVCRKLSEPINTFSDKFRIRTAKIDDYWNKVESNYLLLLDNKYSHSNENFESMKTSIKALVDLKSEILISKGKMEGFMHSMDSCIGLERKLTQSITSLKFETQTYLSLNDKMMSSIDRINTKSEIVFNMLLENKA